MTNDEELKKVFDRYQKLLFKAANSTQSETPYSFVAEFSKKVDAANLNFKQLARRYIDRAIPTVVLSASAESVLRSAGAFHETANVKLTTYVQMVSKLTDSAEQFKDRIQAHVTENDKNGVTTTVSDLKDYIKDELKTGRGMAVTYSNGAQMPVDKYAEMLARTTRTETHNIAMLGKAIDDGNDLVECSSISPTCPTCAMYQGRIYSISGNTAGYPSLYETAFKNGYSIIHPNCRHQFFPYNPKFHTAEERRNLEENTHKPFNSDPQSEAARGAYARSQMQMRQWNNEMNEFAEMQKLQGEEPTYKSLGAFRRAYRSEEGTLAYAKSHYARRDAVELESIRRVLGAGNAPTTLAKFQEMKYNKTAPSGYRRLRQEKRQETDYLTAASGGKHHGKFVDFAKHLNSKQLEKSIRTYNKTIEEHKQKIADPRLIYPDWDSFDERQKAGYMRKWEKDIARNTQERNVAIGVLKRRRNGENG